MSLKAKFESDGELVDYTPDSAVSAGSVVVIGNRIGIANVDIAAWALGALAVCGLFRIEKKTGAITDGADVFWDDDGDSVGGTAGTGAASTASGDGPFMGTAVGAAASGDTHVVVKLNSQARKGLDNVIADPGPSGAIPVTANGHVPIVTAGAETRTLARPSFVGQLLQLIMKTDGGDCVITVTGNVNRTGNNTITLNDAGDCVTLIGKQEGSSKAWSVLANDGASLTTV